MREPIKRARWEELRSEEVNVLKGHVGPGWLPQWFCNWMASFFIRYFEIDDQARHDFGYLVGGTARERYRCDQRLLRMMRRDSFNLPAASRRRALFISDLFYIAVRMFGWLSYCWRDRPLTHDELCSELEKKRLSLARGDESRWKNLLVPVTLILLAGVIPACLVALYAVPRFIDLRRRGSLRSGSSPTMASDEPVS